MTIPGVPFTGPLVPPLPEHETRKTADTDKSSGGGTSTQALAPAAQQALGGMDTAIAGQQEVAARAAEQKIIDAKNDASFQANLTKDQNALDDERMAVLKGTFSPVGEAYTAAKARIQAAQEKYDAMEAPRLFANRDKASQYRLGIGIALAGLGDAMRQAAMIRIGRDPGSASTVKDIIETDLQSQREAIGKAKDSVVKAKTGLEDVGAARKALLEEIDLKGAILSKKAADQMRAMLAARGVSQAEIDGNKAIQDLEAQKAKYHLDISGSLKTTTDSHWNTAVKNGTEVINREPAKDKTGSMGNVAAQEMNKAGSLENEIATIKQFGVVPDKKALEKYQDNSAEAQAATGAGIRGAAAQFGQRLGIVARAPMEGLEPRQQRLINAWDNLFSLLVHDRTGAGMPDTEAVREMSNLKPTTADPPDLVKQKLRRAEWEAQKHEMIAGKSAQEQLRILRQPMPSDWKPPGSAAPSAGKSSSPSAPEAAEPAAPEGARRKSIIEIIKKIKDPAKRADQLQRFGLTEDELNGQ